MNGPGPVGTVARPTAGHAGTFGIFAVDLDRSPDRWATIERHFGSLPSAGKHCMAVDDFIWSQSMPTRWWPEGFPRRFPTAAGTARQ